MGRHKMTMNEDGTAKIVSMPGSAETEAMYREQLGKRIQLMRTYAKLTKAELGRKCGVSVSCIYNWETGRTKPDIANLPALCKALKISISEFFSDSCAAADLTKEERRLIEVARQLNEPNRIYAYESMERLLELQERYSVKAHLRTDVVAIGLLDDYLAAGVGAGDDVGTCSEQLYLYERDTIRRADFACRVSGSSMEPTYENGATVLVQRINSRFDCRPGDIIAFTADNMSYIKEYRKDGFYSHNPAFGPMLFKDYERIYCIGRVIGTVEKSDHATEKEIELYRRTH